ncbi:MAG: peptidoglycan DD-metalloendopeptidase family protein [Sulfuricurvum sp.]|nr:peptidoglycan DD-metalloendopeptidase family protein [Sulfuricurvum sp.]
MGRLLALFLLPMLLFGASIKPFKWNNGESFLTFLERKNLPLSLYYNMDKDDQKLTEDIPFSANCQMLIGDKNAIKQILIPVNDELQFQIYYSTKKRYEIKVIPIVSEENTETLYIPIKTIPYNDILAATGSKNLASIFVKMFKGKVNFKNGFKEGEPIVMVYTQKYRLGKPFSMPQVHGAMVQVSGKQYTAYLNADGRFYDDKGAQFEKFLFKYPIRTPRITSGFSKSRYHPILHRYRAHLGVDFGARPGTPILATGDGHVCFAGRSSGYGNTIKIRHTNGLISLYAHQKSFRSGIHVGISVKQGEVIGYVGSSGLSSGPHLHFGMYSGSTAIDPMSVMKRKTEGFSGKERKIFMAIRDKIDRKFTEALRLKPIKKHIFNFENTYYVNTDTFKPQLF